NPIPAAVLSNIEPLVTIAAAWLILGERLGPLQLLGVALVIAAIIGMTLLGTTRPRAATATGGEWVSLKFGHAAPWDTANLATRGCLNKSATRNAKWAYSNGVALKL